MQTSFSSPASLTRMDRITITQIAATMRDGLTTKENLSAIFGTSTIDRLGALAAEEARKSERAH